MEWTEEKTKIGKEFGLAIRRGQVDSIRSFCEQFPWLVTDHTWQKTRPTWIKQPAIDGNIEVMSALLELGFEINALSGKEKSTALGIAVDFDQKEMASFLLKNKADPNLGRPLIGALSDHKPVDDQLFFVELLLDHGCRVNQLFDLFDDPQYRFTALDRASNEEVIDFLESRGAKKANALAEGN